MKKGVMLCVLAFLFVLPLTLAVSTEITVKGEPGQNLQVNIVNTDGAPIQTVIQEKSDTSGELKFVTEKINVGIFGLSIVARERGKIVKIKELTGFVSGRPAYVNLIEEVVEPVIENEIVVEPVIEELAQKIEPVENVTEITQTDDGITGQVVSEERGNGMKIFYYIAGGILVLVVLAFIVLKIKFGPNKSFVPTPQIHRVQSFRPSGGSSVSREIMAAEQKIREAQAQIDNLKKKQRLFESER